MADKRFCFILLTLDLNHISENADDIDEKYYWLYLYYQKQKTGRFSMSKSSANGYNRFSI